jgi:hypothetical protein
VSAGKTEEIKPAWRVGRGGESMDGGVRTLRSTVPQGTSPGARAQGLEGGPKCASSPPTPPPQVQVLSQAPPGTRCALVPRFPRRPWMRRGICSLPK